MSSVSNPAFARHPFRLDRAGDLAPLRRALEEAGYTESAVAKTVLLDETGKPLDVAPLLRRTEQMSPYNTLLRLFVLARPVPEPCARDALAPARLEPLVELGLLEQTPEGVRAQAALMPTDGLLLVRDFWPDFVQQTTAADFVPGVGPASRAVANLTVRRAGELALDLGTGSGFLALLTAGHARKVIGTDSNARALNIAALNARLNEISNVEWRQGNLYEPVAECRFDLVAVNPPFVISPRSHYEYRDSGLSGDTICQQVVHGAVPLLRQRGYCSVMINWHHQNEEDWAERPTQWLADSGCDAWLLCGETFDPVTYACTWLHHEYAGRPERYARLLEEWLAYYRRLGIGRISSGAVVLRRRSGGTTWLRVEKRPPGESNGSCSDQIQRIFAAEDLLQRLGHPRELLPMRFRLTEDHQLDHVLHAEGGKWTVRQAVLKQNRGFPFVGNVDRLVSTVLAGCNGQHTLAELVADLAAGLGADLQQVASGCTGIIRTLLHSGFLTVDDPPES